MRDARGFFGQLFLSFYFYLAAIPAFVLLFALVYSFYPHDFLVGTTDKGSFYEVAKKDLLNDLCLLDSKRYSLSISNETCIFNFVKPEFHSAGGNNTYGIKSIEISFKEAADKILRFRYSMNYSYHLENKTHDAGMIELNYEHFKTQRQVILFRAIPYISYPENYPLIEMPATFEVKTKLMGPYKGLSLLSMGLINMSSDHTSITNSDGWPWFSLTKNAVLKRSFEIFFEGKPIFKNWSDRFFLFAYYSGVTLMTIGYGDITPITVFSRTLAIVEAFFGVGFFGLLSASFFAFLVNLFSRPWKEFEAKLEDVENWTESRDPSSGIEILYYIPSPDFKILKGSESDDFDEPWTEIYPDSKAHSYDYSLKYKDTILYNFRFISCDGGRGITIMPQQKVMYSDQSLALKLPMHRYFFLIKNSFEDKLNRLVQKHENSSLVFQFNYFDSEKKAIKEIEKSFQSGSDHLTCFRLEKEGGDYELLNRI